MYIIETLKIIRIKKKIGCKICLEVFSIFYKIYNLPTKRNKSTFNTYIP